MMGPRITDYDAWQYCETCDSITVIDDWDSDARMCNACAIEMDEGMKQGGEDG